MTVEFDRVWAPRKAQDQTLLGTWYTATAVAVHDFINFSSTCLFLSSDASCNMMLDVELIILSCSSCQKAHVFFVRFLFSSGISRSARHFCPTHVMNYLPYRVSECLNCNHAAKGVPVWDDPFIQPSDQLGSLWESMIQLQLKGLLFLDLSVLLALGQCRTQMVGYWSGNYSDSLSHCYPFYWIKQFQPIWILKRLEFDNLTPLMRRTSWVFIFMEGKSHESNLRQLWVV